ncbi:MAG: hypothetical protein PHD54_14040 [Desulfuromonadaceae bacterium]|nr:hypothetical protein [Desulfuromonadaceae bacterium]
MLPIWSVLPVYSRDDFSSLASYIKKLKLTYATFTVMTPQPGTELYATREEELLSSKPELYDMLRALLPTRLPLPEFYNELAKLYTGAVPLYRSLPALFKFGVRGLLQRMRLFGKFLKRVKSAHLDY